MNKITRICPALLLSCLPLLAGCATRAIPDNIRLPAEQGDANAQYEAGQMHYLGIDVPRDDEKAIGWYLQAAEQGHPDAQYKLGQMHQHGDGVPDDGKEVLRWYRMAAEQGNAKAQYGLGSLYYDGVGVRKDRDEASKWFMMAKDKLKTAAEGGDVDAQYLVGEAHENGRRGFPKNREAAAEWHRKAAVQGHPASQYTLGVMHILGRGVPKDEGEAAIWCGMAAERDWPPFVPEIYKGELCGMAPEHRQIFKEVVRQCEEQAKQKQAANAQDTMGGECSI